MKNKALLFPMLLMLLGSCQSIEDYLVFISTYNEMKDYKLLNTHFETIKYGVHERQYFNIYYPKEIT